MARELTQSELELIEANDKINAGLEIQRVNAMNSRDAKTYSDLCNRLGVEPELPELIEQAQADELFTQKQIDVLKTPKIRKNAADPQKYRAFLEDAKKCDYSDFSANAPYKRRMLKEHFPGRYNLQHMDSYDSVKLGSVFKHLVESSRAIVTRKN